MYDNSAHSVGRRLGGWFELEDPIMTRSPERNAVLDMPSHTAAASERDEQDRLLDILREPCLIQLPTGSGKVGRRSQTLPQSTITRV
jgi:hypothetical protein